MHLNSSFVVPNLDGKVALVTGSNAGLGFETAMVLATHGARVLLACRNTAKAESAADKIRARASGPVGVLALDLASLASIAACAETVLASEKQLDLLINNAGLMAIDEARTADGFEMQLGVNHLGHFALTALLAPLVLATPGSRIATMSSIGHRLGALHIDDLFFERRRYDRWRPYFQSKLANLLFTAELHRRLKEAGSTTMALAAHPGGSNTDLGHEGGGITNALVRPFMPLMQPAWAGAQPLIRAATDPAAKSGQFYGPQWMVRGRPVVEIPSRRARNASDAKQLWERSEQLTGVSFSIPAAR